MIHLKTLSKHIFAYSLFSLPILSDNPSMTPPPTSATTVSPIAAIGDDTFQKELSSSKHTSDKNTIAFYDKMGREPVWFFQGNLTKCGQIAVETLKDAALDGLNPEDYEDATISGVHPKNWVDAEILLTKRYLEYINHIRTGRVDPARISREIKFQSSQTHPVEILIDAIHDKTSQSRKLRNMGPNIPQYAHLKKILAHYRSLAQQNEDWPIIKISKPLRLGDISPEIKTLRQILILHGDLKDDKGISSKFDKNVDLALRQFQTRHTLEADGVVGGKTKDALNEPIEDLIRKVVINMERLPLVA